MKYKKLEVIKANIPKRGIVNFENGVVVINNDYRPKLKIKLNRKGKCGK